MGDSALRPQGSIPGYGRWAASGRRLCRRRLQATPHCRQVKLLGSTPMELVLA